MSLSGIIAITVRTLNLSGFEHRLWLGNLSRCLQRHFLAGASVKHPAEKIEED